MASRNFTTACPNVSLDSVEREWYTVLGFDHGNIVRADYTPSNPEYHALMQKWLPMCDAFEKMLTPEQLTVFKEMTDLQMKSSEIASAELYAAGFRDGAQLMLEIME